MAMMMTMTKVLMKVLLQVNQQNLPEKKEVVMHLATLLV
jgi:hypothetical protein